MTSSLRSVHLLLAGLALVLVTPVATWFVGAFLLPTEFIEDPDYMIRPLKVTPSWRLGPASQHSSSPERLPESSPSASTAMTFAGGPWVALWWRPGQSAGEAGA